MVLDFLINNLGYAQQDILVMGRSMGSGPATFIASIEEFQDIAALILISPFTHLKAVSGNLLGRLSLRDRFPNAQRICKVKCPVFFIHGQADDVVPCEESKKLADYCSH